jgi:undecaprenyl-diphosphatase
VTLTAARNAPLHRPWRPAITAIVMSGLVFGACWWTLEHAPDRLGGWERQVFTAVNGWPDALKDGLWPIMQLGNFWVWLVGALAAIVIWRRPAPAVTVAVATLAAWLLAKVIKDIVLRPRPAAYFTDMHIRDEAVEGFGFVSGHAAVAFALATALAPWLGRRWLLVVAYTLATLVAVARVYVGAHLPLDVVGGAALGVACGATAQLIVGTPELRCRASTGRAARAPADDQGL